MSTLVVATLKSNSSSPPAFQNTSGTEIGTLCRAWVNFNGTGTVAIRAQFNVSSITDNGSGDYTVNFATALVDVNYAALINGRVYENGNQGNFYGQSGLGSPTTSTFRMAVYQSNLSLSLTQYDQPFVTFAVFR